MAAAILRELSSAGICYFDHGRAIRDATGFTFRFPPCESAEDYEAAIRDAYTRPPRRTGTASTVG